MFHLGTSLLVYLLDGYVKYALSTNQSNALCCNTLNLSGLNTKFLLVPLNLVLLLPQIKSRLIFQFGSSYFCFQNTDEYICAPDYFRVDYSLVSCYPIGQIIDKCALIGWLEPICISSDVISEWNMNLVSSMDGQMKCC